MIDALISGKIFKQPEQRTGASRKTFVTAKVRVSTSAEESIFVSVICFDRNPCTALLALSEGDSVSISGAMTPKVWQDKSGAARPALDLVAHAVLTSYHVQRKRRAMTDDNQPDRSFRSGPSRISEPDISQQ